MVSIDHISPLKRGRLFEGLGTSQSPFQFCRGAKTPQTPRVSASKDRSVKCNVGTFIVNNYLDYFGVPYDSCSRLYPKILF